MNMLPFNSSQKHADYPKCFADIATFRTFATSNV